MKFPKIVKELNTSSNLVESWSKKLAIPETYFVILWKKAMCAFLQNGKERCTIKDDEWPIVTNIFKAEVKKYLSKVNKKVKYLIKNPTIHGKKAKIHYDEARKKSLKEVIDEYAQDLEECCAKCKKLCKG